MNFLHRGYRAVFLICGVLSASSCSLDVRGQLFRSRQALDAPRISAAEANGFSNSYITITPPVPGVQLFYTTEAGKDPVREGVRYTGPFFVGEKKTLNVRAAARDGNLDSAPAHTRFTIEDNHNGFRPAAAIFSAAAPEQSIAPDSSGKVRVKCPSPRFCIDSASVTPVPGTRYFYTIDDSTPLINAAGERLTSSTRELDALGSAALLTSGSHTLRIIALQPGKTPGEVVIIPYTTAGVIARPTVDITRLKKGADGKLHLDKELKGLSDKPWFGIRGDPGFSVQWSLDGGKTWKPVSGGGVGRSELSSLLTYSGYYTLSVRSGDAVGNVSEIVNTPFIADEGASEESTPGVKGKKKPRKARRVRRSPPAVSYTVKNSIVPPAVDIARLKKGTDGKLYIDKDLKKELESITDKPWFPVMGVHGFSIQWSPDKGKTWRLAEGGGLGYSELSSLLTSDGDYTLNLRFSDTEGNVSRTVNTSFTLDTAAPDKPKLSLKGGFDVKESRGVRTYFLKMDAVEKESWSIVVETDDDTGRYWTLKRNSPSPAASWNGQLDARVPELTTRQLSAFKSGGEGWGDEMAASGGNYTLEVQCIDPAGNTSRSSVSFSVEGGVAPPL